MSDSAYEVGGPFEVLQKPLDRFYEGRASSPWIIVVHYSAGYDAGDCYKALADRGLSVHCTIERDGTIWKHVDDENRAIHAGYGRWGGISNVNHHSLGFEIANLGWLEGILPEKAGKVFRPPAGKEQNVGSSGGEFYRDESWTTGSGVKKSTRITTRTDCERFVDHRPAYVGRLWSVYPQEQVESVFWTIWSWVKKYRILPENVVGHEHVTPHRKVDPGPGFPWGDLKAFLETRCAKEMPELLDTSYKESERVRTAQSHLARMGLPVGRIDGAWGSNTEAAAVKAVALYGGTYGFADVGVSRDNCYELACALRLVPGFDPGRR